MRRENQKLNQVGGKNSKQWKRNQKNNIIIQGVQEQNEEGQNETKEKNQEVILKQK